MLALCLQSRMIVALYSLDYQAPYSDAQNERIGDKGPVDGRRWQTPRQAGTCGELAKHRWLQTLGQRNPTRGGCSRIGSDRSMVPRAILLASLSLKSGAFPGPAYWTRRQHADHAV